jgi:sulfatase maturation enzyme AslB (radical SAM superfamily)
MRFSQLAFIVTDDCNFRCGYCPQRKEKIYMKRSTIEKAITFFYPFLKDEAFIAFYGGEPLLAFDTIKYAVSMLKEKDREGKKRLEFSITTNGSLITDEMLQFFDTHRFDVMLSFDGLTQDMTRKSGTLIPTRKLAKRMQEDTFPGIKFSTNSVFTPATVNYLSASLQYIAESGGTDIYFALAENMHWDDAALMKLEKESIGLTDFLVSYYKEKGDIPVNDFKRAKPRHKINTTFTCTAGLRRMAVSPTENVWGCSTFHDYLKSREGNPDFQTYSFGKLDDFIKNHETIYPRVLFNYASLKQEYFFTENQHCFLCPEVNSCSVCPVSAAYATSFIGKISPWVCHLNRILKKEKKRFLQKINRIESIMTNLLYVYILLNFFKLVL